MAGSAGVWLLAEPTKVKWRLPPTSVTSMVIVSLPFAVALGLALPGRPTVDLAGLGA